MKLLLAVCMTLFLFSCDQGADAQVALSSQTLAIQAVDGTMHQLNVELALTPKQQSYGLMNRTSMPEDHGMLFVFGEEAERGFWMKNTLIPLDMIFIRKDGIIHHIHDSAIPNDLTSISSKGPVFAVLELNGGAAKRLGIKVGDKVHHVVFSAR